VTERHQLLQSIANIMVDYRAGEIPTPTPEHVDRWVRQFSPEVQLPLLAEMNHVLARTYLNKLRVETFLAKLVNNPKLAGADFCVFWRNVAFLDIQQGGNSQHEMLTMFSRVLQQECGFPAQQGLQNPHAYIYLDDAIFTGNRTLNDLKAWLPTAPSEAVVHVITLASHRGGQWYASTKLQETALALNKHINFNWWRAVEIEDRKTYINASDVLRPVLLPDDAMVQAYVQSLRYPPTFRVAGQRGINGFFSSEQGRHLLEQTFLQAGVQIRSRCPQLGIYQRPLGNMVLDTLGFGSLLVTFRNCPNNTPLAFWAGSPWYPLFPRKTN
jgi:hypothetical protein